MLKFCAAALSLAILSSSSAALAQAPDPGALVAAQKEKLSPLKWMDGVWRGTAWSMGRDGSKNEIVQTERVGPMLDGAIKVIEGRGYDDDGKVVFNAFGTIAFDPSTEKLSMHSYAGGRVGDFEIVTEENGFSWKIPAGPMTIQYHAKFDGEEWVEYGERIVPDRDPIRFFEMRLKRVGDTEWPADGAVPPKQ